MSSKKQAELLQQRAALRERITHQRERLAQAAVPLAQACDTVDRVRGAAALAFGRARDFVQAHPAWVAAAVAALAAARPRRVLRWGGRLLMLWRGWNKLRALLPSH
jgi:hypothetical protein